VSPDPDPAIYEQTRKALRRIDESLALSGTGKSHILSAILYIADIARKEDKEEMNKAWDEWVWTAIIRRCEPAWASTSNIPT